MIYKNSITADEVNKLRRAVSFRRFDESQIKAGLSGSALVVSAYEDSHVVGMARLIWDGGIVALITDLIVLPDYQNRGIENEMIRRIFNFLQDQLHPGFSIQVDVRAWGNQEILCREMGFEVSTQEARGLPMQICLTEQIELTDARFHQCGFD